MDAKWIATASLAVLVASCSGGIYDAKDFMARKPAPAAEAAVAPAEAEATAQPTDTAQAPSEPAVPSATVAAASPDAANPPAPATVAAGEAAATTAATVAATAPGPADASGPADATGGTAAATPSAPTLVVAGVAPQPKSFFASFFSSGSAAKAAAAAEAAAAEAAPATAPVQLAAAEAPAAGAAPVAPSTTAPVESPAAVPEEAFADEISEAELAGEVEADPDVIAVPELPDDGMKHDFVNVYTSKPDRPVEMYEGLPGVDWPGNTTLAMRTPDGDPSGLFGGAEHPFARVVPGIPRETIRAANGLLLAHSAINVSCLKPNLLGLVRRAESHFGKKVVVTSGYRSPSHNRRVNGAKHSQHMFCNALDLYMPGVARDDLARWFFSQPDRGGIGLYCHTRSIHIDMGKKRQWRWACRGRARG